MAPATKNQKKISSGAAVAIVVGVVVAVAAVIALVAGLAGGSSDAEGKAQNQPVDWAGTSLPAYDSQAPADDPAVGIEAPEVNGLSFDGTPVDIVPGGTPKMVVFVAHWCPFCQAEIPRIVDWVDAGDKPEDLELIAVSTGVSKNQPNYPPSSWLEREDWPGTVIADSTENEAAAAYGLRNYPFIVIIGEDGEVKARHSGAFSGVPELDAFVDAALAS